MSQIIELEEDQVAMTLSFDEDKTFIRMEFLSGDAITAEELLEYLAEFVDTYTKDPDKLFEEGIVQSRIFN